MNIYNALMGTAKLAQVSDPMPPVEEEQRHFEWLAATVSTVLKEQFDAMPAEAQAWFDKAADALIVEEPIPAPAGFGEVPPVKTPRRIGRPMAATPPAAPVQAAPVQAAPVQAAPSPEEHDNEPVDEPEPEPVVIAPPSRPAPPPAAAAGIAVGQPNGGFVAPVTPAPARRGRPPKHQPAPPLIKPASGDLPSLTQRVREYVMRDETISLDDIMKQLKKDKAEVPEERRPTVSTLRYDTLRTLALAKAAGWTPPAR